MLRVKRLSKSILSDRALALSLVVNDISNDLQDALANSGDIFAKVSEDGEYINYSLKEVGRAQEISLCDIKETYPNVYKAFLDKVCKIEEYLNSDKASKTLKEHKDDIIYFLHNALYYVIVDSNFLYIIPCESKEDALKANVLDNNVKHRSFLVPFLSILSLLLFLALLFFIYKLYFEKEDLDAQVQESFVNTQPLDDRSLKEDSDKDKKKIDKEPLKEVEKEPLDDPEDKIKKENEHREKLLKEKALEEQKRLEDERAKAEAKRLQEEAQKAEAKRLQELAQKERQALALKELKKQQELLKKPLCKDLKKKGKMPKLFLAFDGSRSMLSNDIDDNIQHTRLALAFKGVENLVPKIDKRIDIGLIEINGCPLSKDHGIFKSQHRRDLLNEVFSINPFDYDGRTPLVDAIATIGYKAGNDTNDIGIVISDGEDTCSYENLCTVVQNVHKEKPKLKLHVLSISQDISLIRCVADITGGKIYEPKRVSEFSKFLNNLAKDFNQGKVCRE